MTTPEVLRDCSIDGCPNPVHTRPYCEKHRARLRRHGDPLAYKRAPARVCGVGACTRTGVIRNYCKEHLRRFDRYGDPLGKHPNYRTAPAVRFWKFVDRTPTCWLWTGSKNKAGYGQFQLASRQRVAAHRYAYELLVGTIPAGLTLDHVKERGCVGYSCVNPAHLEPVTLAVNVMRGDGMGARNARKERCLRGHDFDAMKRGYRWCTTCEKIRDQRRRKGHPPSRRQPVA